jgi:hypothetical protein
MPSKNTLFTLLSILFRPRNFPKKEMVETPGTAPGSNKLISTAIYYNSYLHNKNFIADICGKNKMFIRPRPTNEQIDAA